MSASLTFTSKNLSYGKIPPKGHGINNCNTVFAGNLKSYLKSLLPNSIESHERHTPINPLHHQPESTIINESISDTTDLINASILCKRNFKNPKLAI